MVVGALCPRSYSQQLVCAYSGTFTAFGVRDLACLLPVLFSLCFVIVFPGLLPQQNRVDFWTLFSQRVRAL
jgi:hypothetical protein